MFVRVCEFFCGIGIFFFALILLNNAIGKSPDRLKNALSKRLGNGYFECFLGFLSSALTQSSTAVNSILVSLTDTGVVKRKSSYFLIMGTNIGTTLTAFFAVIAKINISQLIICIPFFSSLLIMLINKEKIKPVLHYISIVSLIFAGLYIVNTTVPYFLERFDIARLKSSSNMFLFLLATISTALCQSSALISVLTVTLSGYGMLTFEGAMFMIMGANLGTCGTALLSSLGKNKDAKMVAWFNIILNVVGILLHMFLYYTHLFSWLEKLNVALDTKIALFHAFFNVATTLFVFPFVQSIDHIKIGKKVITFYE
ncbi:MAG: Na/Pi cotransporter family protein [Clostridiales bacterium]|nr:Na/Pi cotransporter family protein [Clostridiales bacterium]